MLQETRVVFWKARFFNLLMPPVETSAKTLEGSESSTHYLSDTNRFDVSTKGLCSKRRICLYRLGSE